MTADGSPRRRRQVPTPARAALVIAALLPSLAAIPGAAAPATPGRPVDASADAFDACLAAARARAELSVSPGKSAEELRLLLELDAARCLLPTRPDLVALTGTINAEHARLGADYLAGRLPGDEYTALRRDRDRKYAALRDDPAELQAWSAGDADHDFVPDTHDRCPATPRNAATDRAGCPVTRAPRPAADVRREKAFLGRLANMRLLHNPTCDKAPRPRTPLPIAFGRGHQTKLGTFGMNVAVTKVREQVPGCEIFYELEFRGTAPWLAVPLSGGAVFRAREDLLDEKSRAVFGFPGVPQSPGRKRAGLLLANSLDVSWRVRAVDGSQKTSPWSPIVTTQADVHGVDG